MGRMRLVTAFVLSVVCASSCAQSPPSRETVEASDSGTAGSGNVEEILSQAEREKAVAMTSGPKHHIAWFDQWIADDIVFTGADGQVSSDIKSTVRQNLTSGAWKVEHVSIDNLNVRVFGESAVVTATQTEKSRFHSKDSGGRFQYTHVWVKLGGRWQIVGGHVTRLE